VSDVESSLTAFPAEVARAVFTLPASDGFLLAGGAALLAQRLTTRPTQDLDLITLTQAGEVRRACAEFVVLADSRAWTVETVRDGETFCPLLVHGLEDLLVDIAPDSAPGRPATISVVGPTFAVGRPQGRGAVRPPLRRATSSTSTCSRNGSQRTRASHVGFDRDVFAGMLAIVDRYRHSGLDLSGVQVSELRAFVRDSWRVSGHG
jgi:hypothetical protein